MKTLKQLIEDCKSRIAENAQLYFEKSFSKKMGGTQTIKFEDDFLQQINIDKREYYKGRGARYNNANMHEHIDVFVTYQEFEDLAKKMARNIFERQKEKNRMRQALRYYCQNLGINHKYYNYFNGDVLYFEKKYKSNIEEELGVNLDDFFASNGKTYLFAESNIGLIMFYHNNHQSYSFNLTTTEVKKSFEEERQEWINAPYAHLLNANLSNENLYVC